MLTRVRTDAGISMVCAWCHALIARGQAPRRGGYEHNFGMCRACLAERLARLARLTPSARARRTRRHAPHPVAAQFGFPTAPA